MRMRVVEEKRKKGERIRAQAMCVPCCMCILQDGSTTLLGRVKDPWMLSLAPVPVL
jgi:hypothetical protein